MTAFWLRWRIIPPPSKHRPRIRMTIRQRTRVLDEWPLK